MSAATNLVTSLEIQATSQQPGCRRSVRVLVVDDDRDTLDSMALFLEGSGCEVHTAPDGETALALAEAHRPTLVLLDLAMPRMDGDELARLLRRQPGMEQALLVCISGCQGAEDLRRSREAGCDHHLLKPVDLDQLERLLGLRYSRTPADT